MSHTWSNVLAQIEAAGERVLERACAWNGDGFQFRQEVERLLLGGVAQAYLGLVCGDPDHPEFMPLINVTINNAAPNADYIYMYAPLRGAGVYRLSGYRGTSHFVQFSTGAIAYTHAEIPGPSLANYDLDEIHIGDDGWFEVLLSSERPTGYTGDWWQLDSSCTYISYRQASYDWNNEVDARIAIERVDAPAIKPSVDGAELARRLEGVGAWMEHATKRWFDHLSGVAARGVINEVKVYDYGGIGGLKGQVYVEGMYELAPDEALILEAALPESVRYWSFLVTDDVFATVDYYNRQSSLNGHQARIDSDGRFRAVIAGQDPGVPNWLDTAGYRRGIIQGRWERASSTPATTVRKVKLHEVRAQLPADTPAVTVEERDRLLRQRRLGAQLRRRW